MASYGAEGTYKIDGNLWIEQGTEECPFPGTYEWTFDGSRLSFKLVGDDACDPRRQNTDGMVYTLVDPEELCLLVSAPAEVAAPVSAPAEIAAPVVPKNILPGRPLSKQPPSLRSRIDAADYSYTGPGSNPGRLGAGNPDQLRC